MVHERYAQAESAKELGQHRLFSAKGGVDAMYLDVDNALRMLASRSVDPVTLDLDMESPSFYDTYKDGDLFDILSLQAFQLPVWKSFAKAVQNAEDFVHSGKNTALNPAQSNALEEFAYHRFIPYMESSRLQMHAE